MMKKQNESEILFAAKPVIINGKSVTAKPYSWAGAVMMAKPLAVILKSVIQNIDALDQGLKLLKPAAAGNESTLAEQLMIVIDLIERVKNPEEIIEALSELVAGGTGLGLEEVQTLMPDEMYELSRAVYTVNKAFFEKRLGSIKKKIPSEKQEK